jgi:hypothetical protein
VVAKEVDPDLAIAPAGQGVNFSQPYFEEVERGAGLPAVDSVGMHNGVQTGGEKIGHLDFAAVNGLLKRRHVGGGVVASPIGEHP